MTVIRTRRRRSIAFALVLFAVAPTATALAQRPDGIPVGARVRVETRVTNPRSLTGTLEAADSSAIALVPDGRPLVLLRYSEIESIAVGHRAARPGGAARGAKRGLLFGIGTTVVAAGLSGAIAHAVDYEPSEYSPSVPLTVAIFGVPFTLVSTIVGAVIGGTDRTVWTPVWPR